MVLALIDAVFESASVLQIQFQKSFALDISNNPGFFLVQIEHRVFVA